MCLSDGLVSGGREASNRAHACPPAGRVLHIVCYLCQEGGGPLGQPGGHAGCVMSVMSTPNFGRLRL